jgi:hypothetical protein
VPGSRRRTLLFGKQSYRVPQPPRDAGSIGGTPGVMVTHTMIQGRMTTSLTLSYPRRGRAGYGTKRSTFRSQGDRPLVRARDALLHHFIAVDRLPFARRHGGLRLGLAHRGPFASLITSQLDSKDPVHDNLRQTPVSGCEGGRRGATSTSGSDDPKGMRCRANGHSDTRRSDRSHGPRSSRGLSRGGEKRQYADDLVILCRKGKAEEALMMGQH